MVDADDDWWFWESPGDGAEVEDQSQTIRTEYMAVQGGHPVGQVFRPEEDFLYRIDFRFKNRYDRRPFSIRLWEWIDTDLDGETDTAEYAATVAAPPLWEDTISLPGPDHPILANFFPRVAVTPGVPLLVELGGDSPDAEWAVYSTRGPVDPYPDGLLRVNGVFQDNPPSLYFDLWFRTFALPLGAPPPLTCADSGQPAPCVSSPGVWEEPSASGPSSTAADYLAVVQNKADAGRAAILAGDGANADSYALYDAVLYRATADETYATNIVSLFEKVTQWRMGHAATDFSWGEAPGFAYKWVKDSPSLSAADHEMIKRVLLKSGLDLWPDREGGVYNHAFGRALTFKLITDLIPAVDFAALSACDPGPAPACDGLFGDGEQLDTTDHADWVAYADGRWNEFRQHYDFYEDGCKYSFLSIQFLLELIEVYEADDIWDEPEFKALVERVYEYLLPMGTLPVCGDSRGWSQYWGSPIWLFEKAAARWQDPKYKWMANRVFDYRRTHLKDVRSNGQPVQLWQAVYDEYPSFCHVYFDVDPGVPAVQPADQAEAMAARQDQVAGHEWTASLQAVGQTFQVTATPLVRIDVRVRNGGDPGSATVKLWEWKNSYGATVAEPPIYAGRLDLFGAETAQTRSLLPFLEVSPGATYFVEFSRAAEFYVEGAPSGGADSYADGQLWVDGSPVSDADLWFRSSTVTDNGSKITQRLEVLPRRGSQFGIPSQTHDFGPNLVADKLILRSGHDADDLHAVVNLVRGDYQHGQQETGAVVAMVHRGAALIADGHFFDRHEKDHSKALTRRHWGGTHSASPSPLTVSRFLDYRGATVAWADWGDPNGWNIDHHRRFYFVKNRFLLVRDRTTFNETMTASTGNLWHAHDVHPEHGSNWYSLYDREPLGISGWLYKNPEEYLHLHMVDRNGYAFTEWQVIKEGNPSAAPFKIAQRWVGQAQADESFWFDSLLLPHGSGVTPAEAEAEVDVLHDDGTNVVFKIDVGVETWTVVDNPGELTIDQGGVMTDASYLIARTSPDGPGYLLTSEASQVEVNDGPTRVIRLDWPVRTSVEISDTSTIQDTDADGASDTVDADDDGDGVIDELDAMPYDRFFCRDVDGDTCDDCSTGVDDPANDGPDGDGDWVCDTGDNCPFIMNFEQGDFDGDSDGDACDLDDGLIFLQLPDSETVEWQEEQGFDAWNCYSGDLDVLRQAGVYTQLPGSNPLASRHCGLTDPTLTTVVDPAVGKTAFILSTGLNLGVEGSLGADGSGATRPNGNPCP